jgi:hypothetical protein
MKIKGENEVSLVILKSDHINEDITVCATIFVFG